MYLSIQITNSTGCNAYITCQKMELIEASKNGGPWEAMDIYNLFGTVPIFKSA